MSAKQSLPPEATPPLHVVIRSIESGLYLKQLGQPPDYTASFAHAQVFDYVEDHVQGLIQDVRKNLGHCWQAVPLRVADALETCDACRGLFGVPEIRYTGTQFLCPGCGAIINNPGGPGKSAVESPKELGL